MITPEYWYIKASCDGKLVILGPYNSNEDAYQDGYARLEGDFDTLPLRTRDLSKAVRMIRMHTLQAGGTVNDALQRTRHVT